MHRFGEWIRCTGTAIAKRSKKTVYHKECINDAVYTAITLWSMQSLSESPSTALHFFAYSLLPVYIYSYVFTPGPYRIDRSLLSAVAMRLKIPLRVTVRPTYSDEIGQPRYSYLPVHCMRFAWFECGE